MYKAFWQHDLITYREVLAFSRGEQVERDTLEGRREREMNPWVKGTRNAVQIIIGADRRRPGGRRYRHACQDVELKAIFTHITSGEEARRPRRFCMTGVLIGEQTPG